MRNKIDAISTRELLSEIILRSQQLSLALEEREDSNTNVVSITILLSLPMNTPDNTTVYTKSLRVADTNRKGKKKRSTLTWLSEYADIWNTAYNGVFSYGRAGKTLKTVEEKFGHEQSVAAFAAYCKATEAQFASIESFSLKCGSFIPKQSKPRSFVTEDTTWK